MPGRREGEERNKVARMGSRYDITVFRGVTLAEFAEAYDTHGVVGAEVARPWAESDTVAQIDAAFGSNVVVASEPMNTPDGVNTRLAGRLGAEVLFATVWDTVSTYSLSVVGDGISRDLYVEPSEDEADEEGYGAMILDASGERLPEEPDWELDEAYVQHVSQGRCGIDPGNLYDYETTWYVLAPHPDPDQSPVAAPTPAPESMPAPEPTAGRAGGLWSRVKGLFNG